MNKKEIEQLISLYPRLYHMAEAGSWASIRKNGLMSTSALLDFYGYAGEERQKIEEERRAESILIAAQGMPGAVIRDQKPMDDAGLIRCLQDGLSPRQWYKILNAKVFFWLTEERLGRLINARPYRAKEHDVLVLDTRSVLEAHLKKTWLCPMNSGCTKPFPHPRGSLTFQRVADYPYAEWMAKRPKEPVVELAVDDLVDDIDKHTIRVYRRRGNQTLDDVWTK